MRSIARNLCGYVETIMRVASRGVFSLLLVNSMAMILQLYALRLLARSEVNGVVMWSAYEFLSGALLAVSFIGGEHYLINQTNKLEEADARRNLLATAALFFIGGIAALGAISFGAYALMEIDPKGYTEVAAAALLAGLCFIFGVYLRAHSKFLIGALLERGPAIFASVLIIGFALLVDRNEFGKFTSTLILAAATIALAVAFFAGREAWSELLPVGAVIKNIRNIARSSGARHFSATNIIVFVYERLDQAIILWLFGVKALAVYFICFRISFAGRFLSKAINQVYYVLVAKSLFSGSRTGGQKSAIDTASRGFAVNATCSFVLCAIGMIFEDQLLALFFDGGQGSSGLLSLLLLSVFFSVKNQAAFSLINAGGWGRYYLSNALIVVGVQISVITILAIPLGVLGVAVARVLAVVVGNMNAERYLKKINGSLYIGVWYWAMAGVLCLLTLRSFAEYLYA